MKTRPTNSAIKINAPEKEIRIIPHVVSDSRNQYNVIVVVAVVVVVGASK